MEPTTHGLIAGLSIGLLGAAFWAPYATARVFHLGLAGVYVAVPFVTWTCVQNGLALLPAAAIGLLAGAILSAACETLSHGPLARRRANPEVQLVSSLGIYIVLTQAVVLLGGTETRLLRSSVLPSVVLGGISFSRSELLGGAGAALALAMIL